MAVPVAGQIVGIVEAGPGHRASVTPAPGDAVAAEEVQHPLGVDAPDAVSPHVQHDQVAGGGAHHPLGGAGGRLAGGHAVEVADAGDGGDVAGRQPGELPGQAHGRCRTV